MFCPNCGTNNESNSGFCKECGTNLNPNNVYQENNGATMTEELAAKSKKLVGPIIEKSKQIINKNKKLLIISSLCLIACITGFVLFNKFYDFTKISWDKNSGDANINLTESTTINLKVLAYDKEKNPINDIKFETKDGEITSDGASVEWELPDKAGEYTIAAIAPSGKKITKKIKLVKLQNINSSIPLDVNENQEDDPLTDNDKDGLSNEREKELGTNINLADTDQDGINDYYEANESKTDPLKADTDQDGINDGDELDLELDPLKSDSKGDGIKDGNRELTYTINDQNSGIELQIIGKGNISSTIVDIISNPVITDRDGLLNKIYNFYTTGTIKSANIKIKYDITEINEQGLSEDNLTLYYFNEETKELEEIPTVIDKENKILDVTLDHFSKYVIGDKNLVVPKVTTDIMFVIDNSVSMYSQQQMIAAGYDESTGAIGNDTQFKRLSLTNDLVDMFTGNYKFGVAEFSGNYVNLKEFSNAKEEIKNAINSMKSNWKSNATGTNIIAALNKGIGEFSPNENKHYLLLLTDGKNTEGNLSNQKTSIINKAKENNVKICVIGLGESTDIADLNEIAESTGCDYYHANNSSALDEIYSIVGSDINYNYVDTDGDNIADGMIIADSGFIVTRDGFSFDNFSSVETEFGICYGMATFAMLYYQNKLPMSLDYAHKHTIFKPYDPSNGYNLNNTYFSEHKNLYDFKPSNEALNYLLYDIPSDYRDRIENSTWMIKKEYYNSLTAIGVKIIEKEYNGNDQDFNKYQSSLIHIESDKLKNGTKKDDSQLLSALWRLFILQIDDERTSFLTDSDAAFEELNYNLSSGSPSVITMTMDGGLHGINAIKLIQDINDSNKFKIEVYDNNYAGESRYIEVNRSKYSKLQLSSSAWKNEYEYTFKYDFYDDGIPEDIQLTINYPDIYN